MRRRAMPSGSRAECHRGPLVLRRHAHRYRGKVASESRAARIGVVGGWFVAALNSGAGSAENEWRLLGCQETNGRALIELSKTVPGRTHVCLEQGTQSGWLPCSR